MNGHRLIYHLILLAVFVFIGCGNNENQGEATVPPQNDPNLSPVSSVITYPQGWNELIITANYAKTVVDLVAHFSTSRNACGKDAYGAIQLDTWNQVTANLNTAIKSGLTLTTYCVPIPDDNLYLNRAGIYVDVKNDAGKTDTLFEIVDGQICSAVRDHQISDKLLNALNQVIEAADKEDCPNGWGS